MGMATTDGPAGLLFVRSPKPLPDAERMIYGSITTDAIGNMANLEKIMQLPYTLYLFGPISKISERP
jgi:hypothetical protein